jgi:outer membrane biosynthesis protein TonB
MAMRAIKKAEPFPPMPKEFSDETFEIGIRFHPD